MKQKLNMLQWFTMENRYGFIEMEYLLSSTPCTGNLINNNLATTIAQVSSSGAPFNNQFLGTLNETRIWNVARTQQEIKQYMNLSLPNPTIQPGLLAYYTFDNLLNKQGNTAYNGTLSGSATINATNPNCNFIVDSCGFANNIVGKKIINVYTPVYSLNNNCKIELIVKDAAAFKVGDTVVVMQMKVAIIDSTNTSSFGNIIDLKTAGNYEFNYIKNIIGNSIELKNSLLHNYDFVNGKVQLISVPNFDNYINNDTLTCLPWDGEKGGVLILNVANQITLNQPIDVSGKGFRAGALTQTTSTSVICNENQFFYPFDPEFAASKGESITEVLPNKQYGKGKLATAGGGGNSFNSGGGGGANIGSGGFGGYNYDLSCPNVPFDNRGVGGVSLSTSVASNKVFLGGGGAGQRNNSLITNNTIGNGGGIVLIICNSLSGNSSITANGSNGYSCNSNTTNCHDGMGGGGAGGSILIKSNVINSNINVEAKGGNGGNMNVGGFGRVGPGGGVV